LAGAGSVHFGCDRYTDASKTTCNKVSSSPTTLSLVSGARSEMKVTAGNGQHDATILLKSGADDVAALELSVKIAKDQNGQPLPAGTVQVSTLSIQNDGAKNTPDALKIVGGQGQQATVLLSLVDSGKHGVSLAKVAHRVPFFMLTFTRGFV
jgi:hypothetical protein